MKLCVRVEVGVRRLRVTICAMAMMVAVCVMPMVAGQSKPTLRVKMGKGCGGLHAGIRADWVPQRPHVPGGPYVSLDFLLVNDGDVPVNSVEGGWKIVIDGRELRDSDFIFGNGPEPVRGWGILKPGDWYEFGKAMSISKYFTKPGEYTVSWRGGLFQSPAVRITVPDGG